MEGEDVEKLRKQQELAEAHGDKIERDTLDEVFAATCEWVEKLRIVIAEEDARITERRKEVESLHRANEAALKSEQATLATERAHMAAHAVAASSIIALNVGGCHMETSRVTVTSHPGSLLERMFSGRHEIEADEHGHYFLDRDPHPFKLMLGYLRSPKTFVLDGLTRREMILLRIEFEHFGIPWIGGDAEPNATGASDL